MSTRPSGKKGTPFRPQEPLVYFRETPLDPAVRRHHPVPGEIGRAVGHRLPRLPGCPGPSGQKGQLAVTCDLPRRDLPDKIVNCLIKRGTSDPSFRIFSFIVAYEEGGRNP